MSNRVTWGDGATAGFWVRVAARLIDWLLVGTVTLVLVLVLLFVLGVAFLAAGTATGQPDPAQPGAGLLLAVWLLLLPDFLYDTLMTSRLGWTLGKRAVGIEVRHADGDLLTFGQAAGRYLGRIVSAIPLYLGFLWAAWDPRKQTWHDKMVNCFVVTTARLMAPGQETPAVARPWGGQAAWGIPGASRSGPASQDYAPEGTESPWGSVGTGVAAGGEAALGGGAAAGGGVPGAATDVEARGPAEDQGTEWARELSWDAAPSASGASGPEPEPEEPRLEPEPEPEPEPGLEPEPAQPTGEGPVEAGPAQAQRPAADDPNVVGIERAGIPGESAAWLEQVAAQVDSRLDRSASEWRGMPHAQAARACAFGLLLGHLATLYPHMSDDLSRVAEAHPSFSTLGAGNRLPTLQSIVGDPRRAAAWLGPLIGAEDPEQVARLLD